ncbi:MAG: replicative DNA helicase [Eubacteriales bacterium]|nr:replicative DNA helicase [Eubacteriales bacterium]
MEGRDMMAAAPPSSIDAERSVLGAVLQDAGAATLAFETLAPEDFYTPEHREIFTAMQTLHIGGSPIDLMTVGNELTRKGTLDSVGGAVYLLEAVRFVPTTANTRTYIEIVQEKATLRKLITAAQRISQQCYAQSDPLPEVLRDAERQIFDIVMKRGGAETLVPLQKVLLATFDHIEELSRLKGKLSGVPTGLYDLDRMLTGLHGGELVLVGARPAMGKTSLALGIAQFAALKAKKCVAIFSLEMPAEQIGMRLLCSAANINMQRVRSGMLSDDEWVKLGDCINELSTCRAYIDDTSGLTPSQLRSRCRRLMMEQGLDLAVIDYLGLMGTDKRVENRQLEVSEISRQLKSIALELKIPVLACAQLSRAPSARENKRPMLSDLRDSGSIEQDADVVMFIHREGYYAQAGTEDGPKPDDNSGEIIISKQRNGPVGTVNVEWQAEFARYTNLPGTKLAQYADNSIS